MPMMRCLLLALLLLAPTSLAAQQRPVLVFAAASMKTALDDIAADFTRSSGIPTSISYAASSALAKQIEQAAPADIFISADEDWMDHLATRGIIRVETRRNLVGNSLVLIASSGDGASVALRPGALSQRLSGGRLAVAAVDYVPAGKYARESLKALSLWDEVSGKLAQADNVRAALALVARGEATLGIVYETDAVSDPRVRIVARFPGSSHAPIVYPAAIVRNSTRDEALRFLDALTSAPAHAIFAREGFTPAPR